MTAAVAVKQHNITIERADSAVPILVATGRQEIAIRAGTVIRIGGQAHAFEAETAVTLSDMLVPGYDFGLGVHADGRPFVSVLAPTNPLDAGYVAGFHFAHSGCAEALAGGDGIAAINPYSIWDVGFRPACPDPRGMAFVEENGRRFWADIYLLGVEHANGTSRCGVTIADVRDRPTKLDGKGKFTKLDYPTAAAIYAHHGKRLLTAEEFFSAAYGVKERCSRDDEPTVTGALDDDAKRFVSRPGLFDATGTMWQWGTDGHPDDPRPSIFGGSWIDGSDAGSRCAYLDCWPGLSRASISARGGSDHLNPA